MKRIYKYKRASHRWLEHYQEFENNEPKRSWVKTFDNKWKCHGAAIKHYLPERFDKILTEEEFILEML